MSKVCAGYKKTLEMSRFTEKEKIYVKCHDCRLKLVSRKNVCGVCGVRAIYNVEGETVGIRCREHSEPDMLNVITPKCIGCKNCWIYCPEAALEWTANNKPAMISRSCKGCGVCANECPVKAIEMKRVEVKRK